MNIVDSLHSIYDSGKSTLLDNMLAKSKTTFNRKTGFDTLDNVQILEPSFVVIGGHPAVGKTTFVHQLVEQMLCKNPQELAIWVSYEVSLDNMIYKSLSRFSKLSVTEFKQKYYAGDESIHNIRKQYFQTHKNLQLKLIQADSSSDTIDVLLSNLETFLSNSQKQYDCISPIVVIDYLQMIPHNFTTIKQGIDDITKKLKRFQELYNVTLFVISSFNRQGYKERSMDSFKESGLIESSAEIAWGLYFDDDSGPEKVVTLKCLKNRFSQAGYSIKFCYNAQINLFEEFSRKPKNENIDTINLIRRCKK